ncbi:MAG: MBL fold metallo-hydrolase [Micrococcales bacterium]|nr:MBL fold metallo-hydrolase [Micrococcales bacterium]MCL2668454.1 MBL fold metallo-hydrolase [Micrococcales bacterium]
MRLRVVGCAGSFPSPTSAASGYLVTAEDAQRTWQVVLDLGSGALGPLQCWADPTTLDAVAITHLHADHCADLAVLDVVRRYWPGGPCPPLVVWGPDGTAERITALVGKPTSAFDVHVWQPGVPVAVGPLVITPVAMEHTVPTFGVRVVGPSDDDPTRQVTVAYTGDTDEGPGLDTLAASADVLLAEAGFADDDAPRGIHLTPGRAGSAAQTAGARRLVLTHITPWDDAQHALAQAQASYDGPVDLAVPGMVVVA